MTPEQAKVDPIFQADNPPSPVDRTEPNVPGGSLGANLRSLREARDWSIADVSARLKFSSRQIEALEADQFDELPHGPSLRGMVRNYARLLDADPDAMMQALPAHLQPKPAPLGHLAAIDTHADLPPGTTFPGVVNSGGRGRAWGLGVLILLLLALVVLAAYLFFAWWLPRTQGLNADDPVTLPFMIEESGSTPEATGPVSGVIGNVPETVLPSVSGVGSVGAPAAVDGQNGVAAPAGDTTAADSGVTLVAPGQGSTMPEAPQASSQAATPASSGMTAMSPEAAAPAPASPTAPFVVPGMENLQTPSAAAPADAGEPAPAEAPSPANTIAFNVTGESWIEVRDAGGSVVLSATLPAGETRTLEVEPPARVVIGNANGVTLQWQGEAIDLGAHQRGNVARLTLE